MVIHRMDLPGTGGEPSEVKPDILTVFTNIDSIKSSCYKSIYHKPGTYKAKIAKKVQCVENRPH